MTKTEILALIRREKELLLNDCHNTHIEHWKATYSYAYAILDRIEQTAREAKDGTRKVKQS